MAGRGIVSMTGFGEALANVAGRSYNIRIRTVNHKGLDVRCRVPSELQFMEREILSHIRSLLSRGHVDLVVQQDRKAAGPGTMTWNEEVAREYRIVWSRAAGESESPVDPSWLLQQDGVWRMEEEEIPQELLREGILNGIQAALTEVIRTRIEEGEILSKTLEGRVVILKAIVSQIGILSPELVKIRQGELRQRVQEAYEQSEGPVSVRLDEELLHLADKMDIDEEVTRLGSHLKQFERILSGGQKGPHGKRLGFLSQELMREATTVASKAGSEEISSLSVDARVEIERIREQIMNVE